MAEGSNPIPFNPLTLKASQLVECADQLRALYNALERDDVDAHNIVFHLRQGRDQLARQWAR